MSIFAKKVDPNQQMILDMKSNMIAAMQAQILNSFGVQVTSSVINPSTMFATIFDGKKVPLIKGDDKEEQGNQNAIYSQVMSTTNGDRDSVHYTPDEIEIHAFTNDSLAADEREEAYDIIDAINEANDINRDGTYRTEESIKEEYKEQDKSNTKETTKGVLNYVMNIVQPVFGLLTTFASYMMAIILMTKMTAIMAKI